MNMINLWIKMPEPCVLGTSTLRTLEIYRLHQFIYGRNKQEPDNTLIIIEGGTIPVGLHL